jgi:16S rRNA (guanine527-N7)-methyltransferase
VTGRADYGESPKPVDAASFAEVAGVSHETAARFETWRALIGKWSAKINLVGPSTLTDFWTRHALDSVQIARVVPRTEKAEGVRRWADIGSGAGFPGLAVALALEGDRLGDEVHLLESNQKKAAFLREAVRATGSRAIVRAQRAEEAGDAVAAGREPGFDVVIARACAPLTRLLGYAHPLWKEETVGVFLKGREAEAELTVAAKSWRFQSELKPSRSDPDGRIVVIKRLEHVPGA